MKLLLDQDVYATTARFLEQLGHYVVPFSVDKYRQRYQCRRSSAYQSRMHRITHALWNRQWRASRDGTHSRAMLGTARSHSVAERFRVAEDGDHVTERLLQLLMHVPAGGKQIHDANIVATMLAYGISRLVTHNVSDFRRYAHLIEVLPLVKP